MPNIIGIDHIYLAVANMNRATQFYDPLMALLGFRKNQFTLNGEDHVQYFNRHFGYVLRPAKANTTHNSDAPGLHHFCMRVEGVTELNEIAENLKKSGIESSEPKHYPEYAPDYYAMFLTDPDGILLEITNYRDERRQRHDNWEQVQ